MVWKQPGPETPETARSESSQDQKIYHPLKPRREIKLRVKLKQKVKLKLEVEEIWWFKKFEIEIRAYTEKSELEFEKVIRIVI